MTSSVYAHLAIGEFALENALEVIDGGVVLYEGGNKLITSFVGGLEAGVTGETARIVTEIVGLGFGLSPPGTLSIN
jgi:hypothetical protein